MSKFKVGDRVVAKEYTFGPYDSDLKDCINLEGYTGTVCGIINGCIAVEFDNLNTGHSCNRTCKDGKGWAVPEYKLDLIHTLQKEDKSLTITSTYKGEEKMNTKPEKKTLEQQIKERYAKKRTELNNKIGFDYDMSLEPKKFYYDPKTQTTIIDFGNKDKFKAKPAYGDEYNTDKAYEVIAAKRVYSRFGNFPFESDMSSLESKLTAKFLLYKNTGIALSKYVKYIKSMVQLLNEEESDLMYVEEIRVSQKWKNQERKERRKARKQNKN